MVNFNSRDWKVLNEPDVPSGLEWLKTFGFFGPPGTSVARGLEIGFEVVGNRLLMLKTSKQLLAEVVKDEELLSYNYTVIVHPSWGEMPDFTFSGSMIGNAASISGRPYGLKIKPGHCFLFAGTKITDDYNQIDLRREKMFVADKPKTLEIKRRKQYLSWPSVLPPLIEFLSSLRESEVMIYNHHR
jgi:hypothetical protein